jgi:hypothetical protein
MPLGPYSAPLTPAAITAATDIFHLTVVAEFPLTLACVEIFQTSEVSDAQEEQLNLVIAKGVTGGTGGANLGEIHYGNASGAAPQSTVLGLNTSASTGGTVMSQHGWNVRVPFFWCPVPELRPTLDSTQDPLVVRLVSTPGDSITIGGTVYWFER